MRREETVQSYGVFGFCFLSLSLSAAIVCVCVCMCVAFFPAYKITLVSLIKSELLTKKTDLLHVLNIIACAVKAGDST